MPEHHVYSIRVVIVKFDDRLLAFSELALGSAEGFEVVGSLIQYHLMAFDLAAAEFDGDIGEGGGIVETVASE
jgi:hypothetical protein